MAMAGLSLRRAIPADRPAILAISAQIWDGRDYLPRVIDAWLADQQGELTVALLEGQVVGISRLAISAPGHGWLEGARVHPDHQGKGLGKALTQYLVERAQARDLSTLRYTTSTDNTGSIKLAAALGFRELGLWRRYTAAPGPEVASPASWLGEIPAPPMELVPFSWKLVPWQEELAAKWRREGAVFGAEKAGMVLLRDSRPERMLIPHLWGEPDQLGPLLSFASQSRPGVEKIHYVTNHSGYEEALLQAGFKRADIDMLLFDFPL